MDYAQYYKKYNDWVLKNIIHYNARKK